MNQEVISCAFTYPSQFTRWNKAATTAKRLINRDILGRFNLIAQQTITNTNVKITAERKKRIWRCNAREQQIANGVESMRDGEYKLFHSLYAQKISLGSPLEHFRSYTCRVSLLKAADIFCSTEYVSI